MRVSVSLLAVVATLVASHEMTSASTLPGTTKLPQLPLERNGAMSLRKGDDHARFDEGEEERGSFQRLVEWVRSLLNGRWELERLLKKSFEELRKDGYGPTHLTEAIEKFGRKGILSHDKLDVYGARGELYEQHWYWNI